MKPPITYEDFARLDLQVGTVVGAEPVTGTKLLRLDVEIGGEKRQLVAGIAETYDPASVVGRQVIVLANLAPKRIRGLESQGMLLAADLDGKAVLLRPDREVASGSAVC